MPRGCIFLCFYKGGIVQWEVLVPVWHVFLKCVMWSGAPSSLASSRAERSGVERERSERCRWQIQRGERVAVVDEGRRLFKAKDIRRAPQQDSSHHREICSQIGAKISPRACGLVEMTRLGGCRLGRNDASRGCVGDGLPRRVAPRNDAVRVGVRAGSQ